MRAHVFNILFQNRVYAYKQHDSMDCGPTCLKIIAKYYGKDTVLEILRDWSGIAKDEVSLYGLNTAAEKLGFETTHENKPLT